MAESNFVLESFSGLSLSLLPLPKNKRFHIFVGQSWKQDDARQFRQLQILVKQLARSGIIAWVCPPNPVVDIETLVRNALEDSFIYCACITMDFLQNVASAQHKVGANLCSYEFNTALELHGRHQSISIVCQDPLVDKGKWLDPAKAALEGIPCHDYSNVSHVETVAFEISSLVRQKLQEVGIVCSSEVALKVAATPENVQTRKIVINNLLRTMDADLKNDALILEGLKMMVAFAITDDNRRVLTRLGALEVVVKAIGLYRENKDVARIGCQAIKELASGNEENTAELGRLGACEAIVYAIRTHGATDSIVAQYGCGAVRNLALGNIDNARKLGQYGACRAVVETLNRYGQSSLDIAIEGCFAVGKLAYRVDANKRELGRVGACNAIIDMLQKYGTTNLDVANGGCRSVYFLGMWEGNKRQLRELDAKTVVENCLDNDWKDQAMKSLC
jgi:hypothetical protein